jgi:hypothetical protein
MIKPLGFTSEDVMRAGLKARPVDPYFHNPCSDGVWRWHASALANCPRQQILLRAGRGTDPRPLAGELTMMLGTTFHKQAEQWIETYTLLNPKVKVVLKEVGQWHDTLNLAAKPDLLLEVDGVGLVLLDWKTEHENAAKRRGEDARESEQRTHAKPEHQLQLAATAMCLEANGYRPIVQGHILYVSKNSFWIGEPSQNHVELSDGLLYREVERKVRMLDRMWEQHEAHRELPARLDDKHWMCRPQADSKLGLYCAARSYCRP